MVVTVLKQKLINAYLVIFFLENFFVNDWIANFVQVLLWKDSFQ